MGVVGTALFVARDVFLSWRGYCSPVVLLLPWKTSKSLCNLKAFQFRSDHRLNPASQYTDCSAWYFYSEHRCLWRQKAKRKFSADSEIENKVETFESIKDDDDLLISSHDWGRNWSWFSVLIIIFLQSKAIMTLTLTSLLHSA